MRGKSWLVTSLVGVFALSFLMVSTPTLAAEEVTVGFGSLKLTGFGQMTGSWYEGDNDPAEFKLKRARLLLIGTLIPDRVKFVVQADGTGSPYVLDSKLILMNYIPKTSLTIGRFIPNFTMYMPYLPAKLDMVNYPLTTSKYAMWRQTGIQSMTKTDFVDVTLGIYNGYQYDEDSGALKGNDWGDDNDAKDFLIRADIKPTDCLKIGAFGWFGSAYDAKTDDDDETEGDFDVTRFGANASFRKNGLFLAGEFVMGTVDYVGSCEVDSLAFFVQGLYEINEHVEVIGRFDSYDKNTDADDDAIDWISAGINYDLTKKYHTRFQLNYIMKGEEGEEIDNDTLVLQAQYYF